MHPELLICTSGIMFSLRQQSKGIINNCLARLISLLFIHLLALMFISYGQISVYIWNWTPIMQCITCIYGKYPLYCLFGAYKSELLQRHDPLAIQIICMHIYLCVCSLSSRASLYITASQLDVSAVVGTSYTVLLLMYYWVKYYPLQQQFPVYLY